MTDLVLEHLKRIQADVSDLKNGQRDIKAEIISLKDIISSLIRSERAAAPA